MSVWSGSTLFVIKSASFWNHIKNPTCAIFGVVFNTYFQHTFTSQFLEFYGTPPQEKCLLITMAQMAHFSFPYYFTIPNSEFWIPNSEIRILAIVVDTCSQKSRNCFLRAVRIIFLLDQARQLNIIWNLVLWTNLIPRLRGNVAEITLNTKHSTVLLTIRLKRLRGWGWVSLPKTKLFYFQL